MSFKCPRPGGVLNFYNIFDKNPDLELLKVFENSSPRQYFLGVGSILLISFICHLFIDVIGYHVVALLLLLTVSLLAMFFRMLPIVVVAVLSSLIWNFFFILPVGTFKIHTPEDALLFLMYFVIAVINAVFTTRIRKLEALARQKKEREKTLQLYNILLNSLSHELKTPISTIIGAVDTLKLNSDLLSTRQRGELLTEIDIASYRLHQQVGNLLSMSRLESDFLKLQLDWYDLNELVHRVIQKNLPDSANHQLCFSEKEQLPLFRVDGPLIEQILDNILHNALQYTPPGTKIEIEVEAKGNGFRLEVKDNGPGFPEDKLEQVFEKFYRLPRTAAGGTGLGLAIAKGFTVAHLGNISLRNAPAGGAVFTVNIPAQTTKIEEDHE